MDGAAKKGLKRVQTNFKKKEKPFSCSVFSPPPVCSSLSLSLWHSMGVQLNSYKRRWALLLHPMLHDDSRLRNRLVDGFVRQDVGAIQVKLVVHDHILPQHRHILHTNLMTQINTETSHHHTWQQAYQVSTYPIWDETEESIRHQLQFFKALVWTKVWVF